MMMHWNSFVRNVRPLTALLATVSLATACHTHQGGSCARDSDCDSGLVCEQKECAAWSVRKANAAAADAALRRAARDLVTARLHMGDEATSRLETTIFPHSVLVRDPGKMCFLVRRGDDGTLAMVRRTSLGPGSSQIPGAMGKFLDDIPWTQQGKKNGVCDEPVW